MEQKDKNVVLVIGAIAIVALVAFNLEKITGHAVSDPSSLAVFQDGKEITVQVDYPAGKYGRPNNIIDMKIREGSKSYDATTGCDTNLGLVSRGSADCVREIAVFNIAGSTWGSGDLVIFSVRGSDVSRAYTIR